MFNRFSRFALTSLIVTLMTFALIAAGCERDAGDHMEDAADDIGDAGESIGDAAEQAWDDLQDEIDD
ncbi:MAG: hypothetical protein EA377_09705 [Phycisphaerales bacterium]|nr:MAG: hypothetical protein EA377_09705 [Phycisphaerales bacterium]